MGCCRDSERGENGVCAGERLHECGAIVERLHDDNPRPDRHGRYAFWPRTDDGRETLSCRSANVEYSLAETACCPDDGYMMRE